MSEILKALRKAGAVVSEGSPGDPGRLAASEYGVPALPDLKETSAELGGNIDRVLSGIIGPAPDSPESEQFRVLRTKLRVLNEGHPFRCFGLVSAAPGEGTTTISLGLAAALARESSSRVILVEANLRNPSIERRLGLSRIPGVLDALSDRVDPVPVRRIEPAGFCLLSAGRPANGKIADLMSTPRMGEILDACRQAYDFVLVDCTALAPVADSVILHDLLDGLLLVVRSRTTSRDSIARALTHLKDGFVRGVVFNDHREIFR